MKTKLLTLATLLFLGTSAANAALWQTSKYVDIDIVKHVFDPNDSQSQTFYGEFNILNPNGDLAKERDRLGFNPLRELITDLEISFLFKNLSREKQIVSIGLGTILDPIIGSVFSLSGVAAGSGAGVVGSGDIFETGEDIELLLDSSVFGGSIQVGLQRTGIINYSVTYEGDEWLGLKAGIMAVDTKPVPDSGSLVGLMGAVLIGFFALKRRKA
ncbi:hypothetical protein [Pelagicoccus sp. SDUM812003]|uniref:hypothetical protein n=1 Tax=Pelagicoccus sp. SDUM812003 TaxID=3041267 RepID=UPI0028109774|nr:hypothetical protein [Pelagicoccus sp. SDUM812003]MDQ8205650.1 hypothetical protein [Pelagicoccus sp. SDUM812003]